MLAEFDAEIRAEGFPILCGVDEAGRGPLAGPVTAAAVILPPDADIAGLNDSKKLTPAKRDQLYEDITHTALAYCVASAAVEEIEAVNILQATFLAMRRAVEGLTVRADLLLIDGNQTPPGLSIPVRTIVKGDGRSAAVAAASILAKVTRDRYMMEQDRLYPGYGFAQHKGYGTKAHYEALREQGLTPIHRRSFLKKWLGEESALR